MLTTDQMMGLMPKQKFFRVTENNIKAYIFIAINPLTETPLIIAIPSYDYGEAVVLRAEFKKGGYFLDYEEAKIEHIRLLEEKAEWWKGMLSEKDHTDDYKNI